MRYCDSVMVTAAGGVEEEGEGPEGEQDRKEVISQEEAREDECTSSGAHWCTTGDEEAPARGSPECRRQVCRLGRRSLHPSILVVRDIPNGSHHSRYPLYSFCMSEMLPRACHSHPCLDIHLRYSLLITLSARLALQAVIISRKRLCKLRD